MSNGPQNTECIPIPVPLFNSATAQVGSAVDAAVINEYIGHCKMMISLL